MDLVYQYDIFIAFYYIKKKRNNRLEDKRESK